MSDELSPEMLEEASPDLAVIPYQADPDTLQEDAELILMRIGTDEEGEYMDIVDDDEELLTVGKVFEERLRAMYDIDDSELDSSSVRIHARCDLLQPL